MKFTARVFLVLFVGFLITPSLVVAVKHNADISYVFNFCEEENKTGEKTNEKIELDTQPKSDYSLVGKFDKAAISNYYLMNIELVFLNLITPPPENTSRVLGVQA